MFGDSGVSALSNAASDAKLVQPSCGYPHSAGGAFGDRTEDVNGGSPSRCVATSVIMMGRTARTLILMGGAGLAVLMLGFVVFATSASRRPPLSVGSSDAIVVLTGADRRIEEGVRLLGDGMGRRLLISGVNARTKPHDLRRLLRPNGELFDCCIDFGYVAQDTVGNADETRAWANHYRFARLIIVTSSYHMPRSLAELGRALPEAELVAFPVVPRWLRDEVWWLHLSSMRMLVGEYCKFLPAAFRFAAARVTRPLDGRLPSHGLALIESRAGVAHMP